MTVVEGHTRTSHSTVFVEEWGKKLTYELLVLVTEF